MPAYPLPKGCIFRERFENPLLAQRNGLVVTGNPWLGNGVRGISITSGSVIVPRLYGKNPTAVTIIADVNFFTAGSAPVGSYKELVRGMRLIFGWVNNAAPDSGKMYVANGSTVYSSVVPSGRRTVALVCDGTNATFYVDGVISGSGAFPLNKNGAATSAFGIGSANPVSNSNFWAAPIYEIMIHNYATQPDEIAQYTRLLKGGLV